MLPKYHILLGFFFALFLFFIFPKIEVVGFLIIFLSSFLIDIDHYLYYVFKKRDLSLRKAYKWHIRKREKWYKLSREQRNKTYLGFYIFHGLEISILLFLLGLFVHILFYFIFLGHFFHLFLDLVFEKKFKDRVDRISLVHDFLKFRKLRFIR